MGLIWLALGFAGTALLYASVGFGGGSTYNALLVLVGTDFAVVPVIALICNIVVVTGGSIAYWRAGSLPFKRLWPILILSAPCAWAGGRIPVDRDLFVLLLGVSLLIAGVLMLLQRQDDQRPEPQAETAQHGSAISWPIGMAVGFVSGMVGIGGGIFLAPVLHLLRWDLPRRIAASASLFILVNSLAGLIGQLMKNGTAQSLAIAETHWPLILAVLVGGQIGSRIGASILPQKWVRMATAILILYVAARLLIQR
ncbi:MAG: sulfite exporter TauE/SafE family protein [Blastomonas sp.]